MSAFHDANGAPGGHGANGADGPAADGRTADGRTADATIGPREPDAIATYRATRWPYASSATANGGAPLGAFPVPERPPLPRPERLNRNALTVAAVVMGTLVLAAVIFMPPSRPAPGTGTPSAPTPATGTFLDQPVAGQVGTLSLNTAPNTPPPNTAPPGATAAGSHLGGAPLPPAATDPYAVSPPPYVASGTMQVAPSPPLPNPRALAYEAALGAPLTASEARQAGTASVGGQATMTTPGEMPLAPSASVPSNTTLAAIPSGVSGPPRVGGSSYASAPERFLAEARMAQTTAVRTVVAPAPGPYALLAGTMIPAVLVTEIDSDLPGEVLAQVARDVYDSRTQRAVLVPRGARLLGIYEHEVGAEQRRLLVAWTRLVFPDGRSVALPALQAKDRSGAGGLADRVDRHESRAFGTAALLSLIGAGAQLAQPNGGYGVLGGGASTGQVMAGAVGQQLADVATQMLRRDLDVRPTIRVRQGMPFNVFLNVDLTFAAPYSAERDSVP